MRTWIVCMSSPEWQSLSNEDAAIFIKDMWPEIERKGDIDNWNTAFGWGNHAAAGYDTSDDSWTGTGDIYTTTGNVGIGTTSPSYLLHVLGGSGIVAQFSGRVKGADAVNDDEFVTKKQVESVVTSHYTPTSTSDANGDVGDTSWDSNYFYVKTPDGWKRAALETWESSESLTK